MLSTNVPSPIVNPNHFYLEDKFLSGASLNAAKSFSVGESSGVSAKLNFNGAYTDFVSMFGSGSVAVVQGLTVSAGTGLNVSVSAGTALINGPVQKTNSTTVAVSASTTNYIWLSKLGTFSVVAGSAAPPTGDFVYVGAAITDASSVTSVDSSGVVYLMNGIAYREVSDSDQPLDTPPSGWRGFTKSQRGVYFWTGTEYLALRKANMPENGYKNIQGSKPDSDYTLTASEASNGILKFSWTGWTTGRNVIVPVLTGAQWTIHNALSVAATVKTASGSGVAVGAGKCAVVYCDGTNVVRVTADA